MADVGMRAPRIAARTDVLRRGRGKNTAGPAAAHNPHIDPTSSPARHTHTSSYNYILHHILKFLELRFDFMFLFLFITITAFM